jgi:hypothetical protein
MKNRSLATFIAAGVIAMSSITSFAQPLLTGIPPVEYQVNLNNDQSEFFTLEVKGSAYERGYQQGKALRKVIRPAVNRYKYDLVSELLKTLGTDYQWQDYKTFFYDNTGLYQTALQQAPELVEEIRGIAEGAGLDFQDVFAYNLNFDETFWVLEKMTGIDPILAMEKAEQGSAIHGHCSHGSVWGDGKATVAYTLDWVRHFEGTQALIKHVKEDGTVMLMTTYAGTLIGHGINATQGYTFTPHSKFQLEHNVDTGLAQIFIYRKLIEAGSVAQAIDYLKTVKPAAGLAYGLTDNSGTRVFEVSANKVVEFKTGSNWMAIANVARINNELSSSYLQEFSLDRALIDMEQLPKSYWQYNKDSVQRFEQIADDVKGKSVADMTVDKWQQTFVKKPINKPVSEKLSTSNLWHVVEIDDEFITYHVSPGNPGKHPLEEYRFKYK